MEQIENFVIQEIKKISENKDITKDTKFKDLNFEFIDYIELCLEVEDYYGIFLDEHLVESHNLISDFIDYVKEKIKKCLRGIRNRLALVVGPHPPSSAISHEAVRRGVTSITSARRVCAAWSAPAMLMRLSVTCTSSRSP